MKKAAINLNSLPRPVIFLLYTVAFVGLLTFIILAQKQPYILALLFLPIPILLLIIFPRVALTSVFIGVYSLDWLSRVLGILPTQVRWLPEGVIFATLIYILLRRSGEGLIVLKKTPIDRYIIGLILIGLLSMLVNSSPLVTTLSGFRNLLRPLLLYYVMINLKLDEKYLKRLVILFFAMELFQIPVIFYQYLIYGGGDLASGTLGFSTGQMAVVLASIFMSLFFGLAIVKRSVIYTLLGSVLFLPVLLSEGKAGFFIIPSMLVFLFGYNFLSTANNKTRMSLLKYVFILVPLLVIAYQLTLWLVPIVTPNSQLLSFLANPATIFDRYEAPLSKTNGIPLSRVGDVQFAWQLISPQPQRILLGYGPGQASNGIQGLGVGTLYATYATDPKYFFGPKSAQFTYYAFTQVSAMLQEFGLIGLVLYLLMLLNIFRRSVKFSKQLDVDPFWQGINLGFSGVFFVFMICSLYYRVWFWEAGAYVFWGLAAALHILETDMRAEKEKVGLLHG